MLTPILQPAQPLDRYQPIVGDQCLEEIRQSVASLRGARVLHINSTAYGGGVAEILATLVPLLQDCGLVAEWRVIGGPPAFFEATKQLHNGLQGASVPLSGSERRTWKAVNRDAVQELDGQYDCVVVHDPQPAGICLLTTAAGHRRAAKWVWRCHIDLTAPHPRVWRFIRPYVRAFDHAVFTLPAYVPEALGLPVTTIAPAIDPLSSKNQDLAPRVTHAILLRYGIDPDRPLICQVSRFDPWKDPVGVIAVYREVRRDLPGLQLLLVGSLAADDPEGQQWLERTRAAAGADPDVHVLTNADGVGDVEVNAFQRQAAVVLQKSTREGFGLTVTEALWKGRPVVAGNVGGIPLQVHNGQTGYLVKTVPEAADCVRALFDNPAQAATLGAHGREHVRQHFLVTRLLRDELALYRQLLAA